ncbi:CarD family transcriptional regulator [Anaerotignum sp.]
MFEQGQKIIYPMHGVGIIESIEKEYCVIRIPYGNVRIRIPLANAEKIGLRPLLQREEIETLLREKPMQKTAGGENWNQRNKENIQRLKSGKLDQAAEVVKQLLERNEKKKLSVIENRLLSMAWQIVLSEIISVYEINRGEAEELLAKWMKMG